MKEENKYQFISVKALLFSVLCLYAMFLLPTTLLAQTEYPDTHASTRLKELVALVNSGDNTVIQKYVNDNFSDNFKSAFPVNQHIGMMQQVHSSYPEMLLHKIESSSEYQIQALMRSTSTNAMVTVIVMTEESEPFKLDRVGFRPAGSYIPPAEEQKPETKAEAKSQANSNVKPPVSKPEVKNIAGQKNGISNVELTKFLDAYIDSLTEKDEFSGTVVVAKDGKPIYTKAVGYADKNFNVPNKFDTKFCLASMNKMFTGTAIMQLVQQGKLSVNDKVGKYLPDYPNEEVRNKVTIHQLLTHTSGMGSYWTEFFQSPKMQEIVTVTDYDNLANKNPLEFEPGERFSYSNSGPLVLGLIIEKISGMSYDDYIRKYITGPAGMNNTDCYDISMPIENLAVGYTTGRMLGRSYNPRRNNLFISPVKGGPAGGGYSTVEDLLKFDIALRSNKLLNTENFKLMTTGKVDRTPTSKYAYLFMEKYVNGERIIGHSGGAGGVNSNLAMYMNSGYTVAVMSNYDPPAAENIVSKLETLLTR